MQWIALAVLLFIVFVVVPVVLRLQRALAVNGRPQFVDSPYEKHDALVTPGERAFLGVLDIAAGQQYRAFAKVRVADLLAVRPGLTPSERQTAQNRIQSKHVDFVLCERDTLAVVCAVELDDRTHRRGGRQRRDRFLADAFRSAGLPLLSLPAKSGYSVSDIRSKLAETLAGVSAPVLEA